MNMKTLVVANEETAGGKFHRAALCRDDVSSRRHPGMAFWWGMILSENRYPLFGIML
jgi:hypothetical protein